VTDAQEPCPACGAIDYDEYTPFEEWRGGRPGPDGTTIDPTPVVSCRVCGHEEPEGAFIMRSERDASEDEATRAARIARARAHWRKRQWLSDTMTLRAVQFPIYGAEGWPGQLGGVGSRDDQIISIKIHHYETPDADMWAGGRPRLAITTRRGELRPGEALSEARQALESVIRQDAGAGQWPDASHAAITLWLEARNRERRAAVLNARQSEKLITIDGVSTSALMLNAPHNRWAAAVRRGDLTGIVATHDLEPASLRLAPISDPAAAMLGPEPPDA
jgi:hypothetical protein